MENERFDGIVRAFTTGAPRRTLVSLLLGGAFSIAQLSDGEAKGKKSKKVTLCLNGQTLSVKKSKKGALLRQGATQGACSTPLPPGSPPAAPPVSPPPPPSTVALSCRNGVLSNSESDVDCGGPTCPACANGRKCNQATDCASGHCDQDTKTCVICTSGDACATDANGACTCDRGFGNCISNAPAKQMVDRCDDCAPNLICVRAGGRFGCFAGCGASEICGTNDHCRGESMSCGQGGVCLQPLGGGATRCGTSGQVCGCTSHQECEEQFWIGAFCAQFNPEAGGCSCGPDTTSTTFCAVPR